MMEKKKLHPLAYVYLALASLYFVALVVLNIWIIVDYPEIMASGFLVRILCYALIAVYSKCAYEILRLMMGKEADYPLYFAGVLGMHLVTLAVLLIKFGIPGDMLFPGIVMYLVVPAALWGLTHLAVNMPAPEKIDSPEEVMRKYAERQKANKESD